MAPRDLHRHLGAVPNQGNPGGMVGNVNEGQRGPEGNPVMGNNLLPMDNGVPPQIIPNQQQVMQQNQMQQQNMMGMVSGGGGSPNQMGPQAGNSPGNPGVGPGMGGGPGNMNMLPGMRIPSGAAGVADPSNNMSQLAQIMQKIKSNPGAEGHQQILQLLKQNPQISAAIIKQRAQSNSNAAAAAAAAAAGAAGGGPGNGPGPAGVNADVNEPQLEMARLIAKIKLID